MKIVGLFKAFVCLLKFDRSNPTLIDVQFCLRRKHQKGVSNFYLLTLIFSANISKFKYILAYRYIYFSVRTCPKRSFARISTLAPRCRCTHRHKIIILKCLKIL
jgi:hypothetical protein